MANFSDPTGQRGYEKPIPATKMTHEVITPQKIKVVPIANPAGK